MWKIQGISIKGIVAGVFLSMLVWPLLGYIGSYLVGFISEILNIEFSDDTTRQIIYRIILVTGMLIALLAGVTATHFSTSTNLMNATICGGLLAIGYPILYVTAYAPNATYLCISVALGLSVIPLSILGGWIFKSLNTPS